MSGVLMEEEIKRWTARRKSALVLDIIQGKTTVSEASRQFDLPPSEIENWVDDGKRGMENALRAKPEDVREQYERQLKDLQEAYGEAMLEIRARKSWHPCWARTRPDGHDPAGTAVGQVGSVDGQAVPLIRGGTAKRVLPPDQGAADGQAASGRANQGADRGRAVVRLPHGGGVAGNEQEHRAADFPAQGLAGP